jgi:hypothetical protein
LPLFFNLGGITLKYTSDKNYYFMQGFDAAKLAYGNDNSYKEIVEGEIKHYGIAAVWSEYSEYNFAYHLDIKMPEDEKFKEYVYQGIKAAMDIFHYNIVLKTEGVVVNEISG